jgi:hypothetical protein
MATWFTTDEARDQWVDAPLDDDYLEELLQVAKAAVLAYAPALPTELVVDEGGYVVPSSTSIPTSYRQAQIMQTRNVFNASKAAPGGEFDGSSYGITTHPLDWQVKQLLRPRTVFGGPVG